MHTNLLQAIAAGLALCALSSAALAAGPVYEVTCLDCTHGSPLMPLRINATGVVAAIDDPDCNFPGGCSNGQGYVIDHGLVTRTPSFDDGVTESSAQSINDADVVVGSSRMSQWPNGPFGYAWDGTTMTNLGDSINHDGDGYWSRATAINGRGHIAGSAASGYHDVAIFLYKNHLMSPVPTLAQSYITSPYWVAINEKDHIVGTASRWFDDTHHAWISQGGVTTDLAPDSYRSEAYAVNDADQVVGFVRVYQAPENRVYNDWPVIWHKGGKRLLNTLAGYADHGQANAINTAGWVVGDTCNTSTCTPFVFNGRKMFDLNTRLSASSTGWILSHATGINASGVIVGMGSFDHEMHAFVATPLQAPGPGR